MKIDFETELNKQQFEAVSSDEQYLRIVAGAGSGKTRVLVYRVLYLILNKNIDPSSILAITFTNKAACEMKSRIKSFVNEGEFRKMLVLTFHSFCSYFLRREISQIGRAENFSIMDDDDQKNTIKNICKNLYDSADKELVNGALSFISFYSSKNKRANELNEKSLTFQNDKRYFEIFKAYEEEKEKTNNLDFDDLLNFTVRILRSFPATQKKWSERFSNILIDEFQDTNDVQHELLMLLLRKETGLFVVGDPDQAIYGWRGANTKLIMDFEKTFPNSKTIILNENYRSTRTILDSANKLISFNKNRVKKDLFTNKNSGSDITIRKCFSKNDEGRFVADQINYLVNERGYSYKDIAILYRTNFCSGPIEKALTHNHIPLKMYGGLRFYKRMEIKDLIGYFTLFVNPLDDIAFLRIINVPKRKIGDACIATINEERAIKNQSIYQYLNEVSEKETNLTPSNYASLKELINILNTYSDKLQKKPGNYPQILEEFIYELGYINYLNDCENSDERKDNVAALVADLKDFKKEYPEESFQVWLQNALLTQSSDDLDENADCVSLMTIHVAKGLEYKVVFVVAMNDGVFPHSRTIDESPNGLEEERRLCYVAMTRAKEVLYLSYSNDMNFASGGRGEASKFLIELGHIDSSYGDEHYYEPKRFVNFRKNTSILSNINYGSYKDEPKEEKNSITWEVNDICEHEAFGVGKILSVDGVGDNQTINVEFIKCGKKTLMANHKALRKVVIN